MQVTVRNVNTGEQITGTLKNIAIDISFSQDRDTPILQNVQQLAEWIEDEGLLYVIITQE